MLAWPLSQPAGEFDGDASVHVPSPPILYLIGINCKPDRENDSFFLSRACIACDGPDNGSVRMFRGRMPRHALDATRPAASPGRRPMQNHSTGYGGFGWGTTLLAAAVELGMSPRPWHWLMAVGALAGGLASLATAYNNLLNGRAYRASLASQPKTPAARTPHPPWSPTVHESSH